MEYLLSTCAPRHFDAVPDPMTVSVADSLRLAAGLLHHFTGLQLDRELFFDRLPNGGQAQVALRRRGEAEAPAPGFRALLFQLLAQGEAGSLLLSEMPKQAELRKNSGHWLRVELPAFGAAEVADFALTEKSSRVVFAADGNICRRDLELKLILAPALSE